MFVVFAKLVKDFHVLLGREHFFYTCENVFWRDWYFFIHSQQKLVFSLKENIIYIYYKY